MRRKNRVIKVYAQKDQATSLGKARQMVAMQNLADISQSLRLYETAKNRKQKE